MRAEAAIGMLRTVWPASTAKHAARTFNVSVSTAKSWFARGFPAARLNQLCDRLETAIARRESEMADLRRQLDALRRRDGPA